MKFYPHLADPSNHDKFRGFMIPENTTSELAEFIGILAGDGHVSFTKRRYQIRITGSADEKEYLKEHVSPLLRNLFNLDCLLLKRKGKKAYALSVSSKGLVTFLRGIGYFKHTVCIQIPPWLEEDTGLMRSFLRGIFDTDGCIFCSQKPGVPHYPTIELTTICQELAQKIAASLKDQGFRVGSVRGYKYRHSNNLSFKVSLYGKENLRKWNATIGFSNLAKREKAEKMVGTRELSIP